MKRIIMVLMCLLLCFAVSCSITIVHFESADQQSGAASPDGFSGAPTGGGESGGKIGGVSAPAEESAGADPEESGDAPSGSGTAAITSEPAPTTRSGQTDDGETVICDYLDKMPTELYEIALEYNFDWRMHRDEIVRMYGTYARVGGTPQFVVYDGAGCCYVGFDVQFEGSEPQNNQAIVITARVSSREDELHEYLYLQIEDWALDR